MSRTYRRKHDKVPDWVNMNYEYGPGYLFIRIPETNKKKIKENNARWHSDAGWHGNYSSCPGWWHHDFHEVPMRAKTRNILKDIKNLKNWEDSEDFLFPLYRKPYIYYW